MLNETLNDLKQVIVMRTDLNMRKGKMTAQGSHASMAFITRNWKCVRCEIEGDLHTHTLQLPLEQKILDWCNHSFKKIVVGIDSEEGLLEIDRLAREAGITSSVITDNGATEFHGVPTRTCLALGPDYPSKLDPITGGLKLL